MRRTFHLIVPLALAFMPMFCPAQELAPDQAAVDDVAGDARLGLSVAKPDQTTTTHLPNLPPGIGFVVKTVEKGGPADDAGIREFDLVWKMNEQMLVNEGQLATLLRLSSPGDLIDLSIFRAGEPLDLKLKLGKSAEQSGDALVRKMLNDTVMREQDGAVRIVRLEDKKAVFLGENGSAEVYQTSKGDAVRIKDPDGKLIFEATLQGDPDESMVPDEWKRQVCAMRRSLSHALSVHEAPVRRVPRPRIVPPAIEKP